MKRVLAVLFLACLLAAPALRAADGDRDALKAMLERPELARELEAMGIPADEARARVDALTDAEAAALAGRLGAVPAGGAPLTYEQFLIVLLLIILLVLLL